MSTTGVGVSVAHAASLDGCSQAVNVDSPSQSSYLLSPPSDTGKESGIISGKNPCKRPGKNSGKEAGQDKNVQDKATSLLRVRNLFVYRNIKFIQD
jgi:hypothetical protein